MGSGRKKRAAPEGAGSVAVVAPELYSAYFRKLVSDLAAAYGAGPPDPEDVAQRAFVKLNIRGNIDQIKDPEAYVWIAARNIIISEKCSEMVRTRNKHEVERRFFGEGREAFDPERVFIAREQLSLVMEVLEKMPTRRREIFMWNRVYGLTIKEAGRRCGVSQTAAHRHISVAMREIAEALTEEKTSNPHAEGET